LLSPPPHIKSWSFDFGDGTTPLSGHDTAPDTIPHTYVNSAATESGKLLTANATWRFTVADTQSVLTTAVTVFPAGTNVAIDGSVQPSTLTRLSTGVLTIQVTNPEALPLQDRIIVTVVGATPQSDA